VPPPCFRTMATSLKILQTCFSPSWGGLEMQAIELSRQLHSRGHGVWLAAPAGSRLASAAAGHDFRLLTLGVRGYLHPALTWNLSRFIRDNAIDVIHCQHSRDLAVVVPAQHLAGRHTPVLLSKRMGSYIQKKDLFHRYTYGRLRYVLAISDVIHRNVLATTPMSPERVLTLHDAVDLTVFDPARIDRTDARRAFGVTDDTPLIGFVGRFSPGKGHEELLEAAAALKDRGLRFRTIIVGEASHGEETYAAGIKARAEQLGLDGIVSFAGYRADVPAVMSAFDVFAFPSHAESFGVVLIEAMAMKRAVVATNCDGVVDIVVDGVTGLMVPPRASAPLADALERLLRDRSMALRMGEAGRRRVEECFDQQKQIDRLEAIYREVTDGR
jgi:glycosyltransferase involved in cell wall biosynthesis